MDLKISMGLFCLLMLWIAKATFECILLSFNKQWHVAVPFNTNINGIKLFLVNLPYSQSIPYHLMYPHLNIIVF